MSTKTKEGDKQAQHVALYRKYRPRVFKDVVGQDHVVKVLESAIKNSSLSHAYLFSGSRGIGKTSIARIFAREIGTADVDIYEIDAASHTSVEDIRALNEAVFTLPFESKYKVYILDEVHMLSKSAFNALLKTLEEPPAHVIFILATTEEHKIPETVISRCQAFSFGKPSQAILSDVVLNVAKAEGYSLTRESAELIALLGDGSFRDTLGLLQKVVTASKDKKIDPEEVEIVTGAPAAQLVRDFVDAVATNNAEGALAALGTAVERNGHARVFLKLVLRVLREALLLRLSPGSAKQIEAATSAEGFAFLKALAADVSGKKITSKTLLAFLEAYDAVDRSYIPELPIELAVAQLCGEEK
jgi:DNA polymerase-3 subunit gamma/tau